MPHFHNYLVVYITVTVFHVGEKRSVEKLRTKAGVLFFMSNNHIRRGIEWSLRALWFLLQARAVIKLSCEERTIKKKQQQQQQLDLLAGSTS